MYWVGFVPAAAILVRRATLLQIGGFDPLFFMYGEDDDLCRRVLAGGWKIGFVPDAVVQERILNRRLCPKCGLDYNLIFHRPTVANTCDICGAVLIARPDDTPEAVRARLQDYHTKTKPILELFRRKELVVVVDGTRSAAEVQQELRRQLVQKVEAGVGY